MGLNKKQLFIFTSFLLFLSISFGQGKKHISFRISAKTVTNYSLSDDMKFAEFVNPENEIEFSPSGWPIMLDVSLYADNDLFIYAGYEKEFLESDNISSPEFFSIDYIHIKYDTKYIYAGLGYVVIKSGMVGVNLKGGAIFAASERWLTLYQDEFGSEPIEREEAKRKSDGIGGDVNLDFYFDVTKHFEIGMTVGYQFLQLKDFELDNIKESGFTGDLSGVKIYAYTEFSF